MKIKKLLFFSVFVASCSTVEKSPYDSLLTEEEESIRESKSSTTAAREVAYLKQLSESKERDFQFIIKQIQEVIKNYKKMKQELLKMETKLELLFRQYVLDQNISSRQTKERQNPNLQNQKQESLTHTDEIPIAIKKQLDHSPEKKPKQTPGLNNIKQAPKHIPQSLQPNTEHDISSPTDRNNPSETMDKTQYLQYDKKKAPQKQPLAVAKNLFQNRFYENAISEFQKYRDKNPQGEHYPEATFYIGQSFKKLKMPVEADIFFTEIVQSHPQSLWASRAKKVLKK